MRYEIRNTGDEPLALSNGSILAPGETSAQEDASVTVGPSPETTLQSVWDKVHALEARVVAYFEPGQSFIAPIPDQVGKMNANMPTLTKGDGNVT